MRAYMKPRMSPSRRTWGKIPIRSGKSMGPRNSTKGRDPLAGPSPLSVHAGVLGLLERRGRDGQPLHFLVVAPLPGIVGGHLEHEVKGLLRIAFLVELDRSRDPRVLRLPHGDGDLLAARHLAAAGLDRRLDGLQADGRRVIG